MTHDPALVAAVARALLNERCGPVAEINRNDRGQAIAALDAISAAGRLVPVVSVSLVTGFILLCEPVGANPCDYATDYDRNYRGKVGDARKNHDQEKRDGIPIGQAKSE